MKNVLMGVSLLITVFFAFFANIKSSEADLNKVKSLANMALAEKHRKAAEEQEKRATKMAADLIKAEIIAKKEIDSLKKVIEGIK